MLTSSYRLAAALSALFLYLLLGRAVSHGRVCCNLSGTETQAVVKHYSIHNRYTDETQGKTLKHNCVSRHRFPDRPASQTRNATQRNDTQPIYSNTQPIHNQHSTKTHQTQTKHNHTQVGPNPQSAEGGGANHTPKHNQNTVKQKLKTH